jgi:hypothetical protein
MASQRESEPAGAARPKRRRAPTAAAGDGRAPAVASAEPAVVEDGSPIQADRVEVRMGAVGRAETRDLEVVQGAVGAARADTVTIAQGALGASLTGSVHARRSFVRSLLAREARVEQSFVRTLVAAEVRVERATGVGILIARRVTGDVRVLLDWRGAAALGAAFGLVVGLLRRGRGGTPPRD